MILHLKPGETGYEAVEKIVLAKYGRRGESILVQLRTKHLENEPWYDQTELLLNDGEDCYTPKWIWEIDWWEGAPFVDLVAAAPVSQIDISGSFAMEGPEQ